MLKASQISLSDAFKIINIELYTQLNLQVNLQAAAYKVRFFEIKLPEGGF